MYRLGKAAWGQPHRGFESPSLRKYQHQSEHSGVVVFAREEGDSKDEAGNPLGRRVRVGRMRNFMNEIK